MSMSVSVSVMGGGVGESGAVASKMGMYFLAGICGVVEGGRGLGWGCGGDVDDDIDEEGCWWRDWRLKFSCENFVDFLCCGFFCRAGLEESSFFHL